MNTALTAFNELIRQENISSALYEYLVDQRIPLDFSDLLQWQWTLAVSALDGFVHDVVRIGMVQQYEGRRTQTPKYKSFQITLQEQENINSSPLPAVEFEKIVAMRHSYLAFQYPDRIVDALSYIWDENNKWEKITNHLSTQISSQDSKTKLKNIIARRNQIVHEGDCLSRTLPLQQQVISKSDTDSVISFIKELVYAIYVCIPNLPNST